MYRIRPVARHKTEHPTHSQPLAIGIAMHRTTLLGILLFTAACGGGMMPEYNPMGAPISTKKVVTKSEPATLIAGDGSACAVSPDRFEGTRVGDFVRCSWRGGSGAAIANITSRAQ